MNKYQSECKNDENKIDPLDWHKRIFTIKELYPYISDKKRNGHCGHMFRQRLVIHYYYSIPIELMDFVSGTIYNASYSFSTCTIMLDIFKKFAKAFMNDTEYPLTFDQPLSKKAVTHIIISIMHDNSIL